MAWSIKVMATEKVIATKIRLHSRLAVDDQGFALTSIHGGESDCGEGSLANRA